MLQVQHYLWKTSFVKTPCTPALGVDPFSTAMGTRHDQSQKNPPKCCRKQQPSFRLPPCPIIHSRVKALKISSNLTPSSKTVQHHHTNDSGALRTLPRTWVHQRMDNTHPTAQPVPSLLLPQLLPCPALPLPSTHPDVAHHWNWEQPPWLMAFSSPGAPQAPAGWMG